MLLQKVLYYWMNWWMIVTCICSELRLYGS